MVLDDGRTGADAAEIEELHQRVEELEAAVALLQTRGEHTPVHGEPVPRN